ncbi:NAD(P)-bd-dom domain-containing protein [Fusarium sp. LHS14.1]|nr:NAD(P)-bd-dom domain-containing protein [Fusarium sp. LHS14.1]
MGRHALILGGHGKVAQILMQALLRDSWAVTSVIRAKDQVPQIESLAPAGENKLNVLVHSTEDVQDVSQAKDLLSKVKPDVVVWSAGAGGKGGPERTFAIDRDAAVNFIKAAVETPTIKKFILISYLACRQRPPHWWNDASWKYAQEMQSGYLQNYCKAKLAADEILLQEASKRADFVGISLRPGMLSDEPAGQVELGKTAGSEGDVSRESVAKTIVSLLNHQEVQTCWLDMLDGDQDVEAAVDSVVTNRDNAAEGEDVYLV